MPGQPAPGGPSPFDTSPDLENERQPFAQGGFAKAQLPRRRSTDRARREHLQSIIAMVLVPWLMFVVCTMTIGLAAPGTVSRGLAWAVAAAGMGFAVVCLQVYFHSKAEIYRYLAFLCALAVLLGVACGWSIYDRVALRYWTSTSRSTYADVVPSAIGGSYADAAALAFVPGSRVDARRSLGYRGAEGDGSVYCVAPILDRTLAETGGEVQYWAIGSDCCAPSWGFRCGDVQNPKARSGLILSRGMGSADAQYKWGQFYLAAKQAGVMYGLRPAEEPVFLFWTEDEHFALARGLDVAVLWAVAMSLLYLMVSLVAAGYLHYSSASRRQSWQQAQPSLGSLSTAAR